MKKTLFYLFVLLAAVWVLPACSDKDDPGPEEEKVDKGTLKMADSAVLEPVLDNYGGFVSLTFTASAAWEVRLADQQVSEWLTIAPEKGTAGTNTIMITVDANEVPTERKASITLVCGEATCSIVLTQQPGEEIDPRVLQGKWFLGIWRSGSRIIQFDGTECINFQKYKLDWTGRQDGSESYTLVYAEDYATFTLTSTTTNITSTCTIIEYTDQRLVLCIDDAYRYFYPTPEAAKNARIDITDMDDETALKPTPDHALTTDIDLILSWKYISQDSGLTPMGAHFEQAKQASSVDIAWLANPDKNPVGCGPFTNWKQCSVTLYPFGEPSPADINQHAIGDCSACADFAALAYQYPDFIKHIITDHGNGTYTVDMYDPNGVPIQVGVNNMILCDDNGTIAQVTSKNNVPAWPTLLEKAMMKWQQIYEVDQIEGIGSENALPLFVGEGKSFAYAPNMLHAAELAQVIRWSLDQGYVVIGGFDEENLLCGSLYTVTFHAFTLMYPYSDEYLFAMRNPWGIEDVDGRLDIPDVRRITQAIDIRVIYPGAAAPYLKQNIGAYIPPVMPRTVTPIGVSRRLLNKEYLR